MIISSLCSLAPHGEEKYKAFSRCEFWGISNDVREFLELKLFNIFPSSRLTDDDDGAAETGVKETTRVIAKYPHPTNDKIFFWDLPGIGKFYSVDQYFILATLHQ